MSLLLFVFIFVYLYVLYVGIIMKFKIFTENSVLLTFHLFLILFNLFGMLGYPDNHYWYLQLFTSIYSAFCIVYLVVTRNDNYNRENHD